MLKNGSYHYIWYIVLDSCPFLNTLSNVRSQVRTFIASIWKSHSDILCCFWTWKCGGAYWPYWYIGYKKRYVCNVISQLLVLCNTIYFCDVSHHNLFLFYTTITFDFGETLYKNNSLFLAVRWQSITILEHLHHHMLKPHIY